MKYQSFFRKITTCVALVAFILALVPMHVFGAFSPPNIISYQGRLTDSGGNLLGGAGTSYYFRFSIWDSATVGAGTRVWPANPSTTTVTVTQGVFTVNIGDTPGGYPDALNVNFSSSANLYLQVEVSSDNQTFETLSPRQQLTSAIYAQIAGAVVGTTTPSLFGTTTPLASSFVTIQATSSAAIPLSVLGASGQTANIFQIQNSAFQNLFSVSASGVATLASALTVANGGTGISSYTPGDMTYANSPTSLARVASSSGGTILQTSFTTGAPTWVSTSSLNINFSNLVGLTSVAQGGTGSTTLTGLLVGNTTSAVQTASVSSPLSFSGTTLAIANAAADGSTKGAATFTAADFNDNGSGLISLDYINGQKASASLSGFLSTADWSNFNGKLGSTSLSGGAGIAYNSSTGVITNTIAYPFPSNATTTLLNFNGNASTTQLSVTVAYFGGAATSTFNSQGWLGIGSSTPWAQLSINPTAANGAAPAFAIGSSTGTSFVVTNGGRVGVGTSTPFATFSIFLGSSSPTSPIAFNISSSTRGISTTTLFSVTNTGFVSIGSTTPWAQLSVNTNGIGAAPSFAIGSSTQTNFMVTNMGSVGIGTSSPYAALSVVGSTGVVADHYTATSTTAVSTFAGFVGVGLTNPAGLLSVSSANVSQAWVQVGNSLSLPAFGPGQSGLAMLSPKRVAFVDNTNTTLATYEFNGTTWTQVGSGLSVGGGNPTLAALSPNRVAFIDEISDALRVYEFTGTAWSQIGVDFPIATVATPALTALSPNRVAFVDGTNGSLRTYEFNGSTWAQVGSGLTIATIGAPTLTTLSPNRVAFLDDSNASLRTYEFNGKTWSQVGRSLSLGVAGNGLSITALSPNRIAEYDGSFSLLQVFEFDGGSWSQVGTALSVSGASPALAALSPNRIAFVEELSGTLRTYQFATPLFTVGNSQDYPYLSVSDAGYTTAEGLAVRTGLTIGQSATSTWATSTPTLIVNGTSVFSGMVGLGTTSPYSQLAIVDNRTSTSGVLFAAASSAGSTLFAVDNTGAASTTFLYGAQLSNCTGSNKLLWSNGVFSCAADQTAAGAANPFIWTTNYGTIAAATTSPLWAQNGIFASTTSHFVLADFTAATSTMFAVTGTASTTNLTVSSAGGTPGCATFSANGTISNTGVSCGGSSFSYPFPGNATTTALTFSGLTTFSGGASTTNLSASNLFVGATGTTSISAAGTLTIQSLNGLLKATNGVVSAATLGTDYTNFGYLFPSNATTTLISFNGNASTTQLSATVAYFGGSATSTFTQAGWLGIGSSTPWAQLSINPTAANGAAPAFAIGSSTGTSFVVTNGGNVGLGTTSPFAQFTISAASTSVNKFLFVIASTTNRVASSSSMAAATTTNLFAISNTGNVGLSNDTGINWGAFYGSGSTGYGLRENGGIVEFRNAYSSTTALASSWTPISSAASVRYQLNETGWANTGSTLPGSLGGSQAVVIGDYVYLFGGDAGAGSIAVIYRAPLSNPTAWVNTGAVLPGGASLAQASVVGDYVYLFGGSATIYRAPLSNPTAWVDTGAALPGALTNSQLVTIGDYLYLFGGNNGSNVIYRAPVSNPTVWSDTGATLPGVLGHSQAAVIGDYVYLFGGFTGAATNVIYRAPISNPTAWVNTGAVLPSTLYDSQLTIVGDYVYLFGGVVGVSQSNVIYRAPLANPTAWINTNAVLPGTHQLSQNVIIGDYLYQFGGSSGNNTAIWRAPITSNMSAFDASKSMRLNVPTGPWFNATSSNSYLSYLSGGVNIGTTTATWSALHIASSTGTQLQLSDNSGSTANWAFRNAGGNLYVATSSPTSLATTTQPVLTVFGSNGFVGLGSSTPWAQLSINPSAANGAAPAFAIGSSTGTSFVVLNSGNVGVGTVNPSALFAVNGLASTTNLTVSSAGGTAGCATFSTNGTISNTGTACGGGSGFSYLFPNNATTTLLTFNGGASTTQISAAQGFFNAIFATSTTATSTFAAAITVGVGQGTSTFAGGLSAGLLNLTSSTASSTFANGVNLTAGCLAVLGVCLPSTASANSWSALQLFNGNASTTQFSATVAYFGGSATSTFTQAGWLGIGSSTPWAQLSINPTAANGAAPAFAIGSSTATNFVVTSAGNVGIGTSTPNALFALVASSTNIAGSYFSVSNAFSTAASSSPFFRIASTSATIVDGGVVQPVLKGSLANGVGGALLNRPIAVFVSGNYAYVASNVSNALEIVDISNPGAPVHKGSISNGVGGALLNTPAAVFVSGNYAYVVSQVSNALEIIDVSNPAAPVHKGSLADGVGGAALNIPTTVFVSGNYAYVASQGSNALEIIDVSNPVAPVHKGSLVDGVGGATLSSAYGVYVSGNYAYVGANGSNALEIVDVSNPAAPVHKGSLVDGVGGAILAGANYVFVSGNYAYVTSFTSNALEIVDVSNPAAPVHKGSISDGSGGAMLSFPRAVFVSDNYAYVASFNSSALEIVDVSNPAAPVHKSAVTDGGISPYGVFVSGNYAYVTSYSGNALEAFDIGGVYIANGEYGSAKIDTLQVNNFAQFNQNLLVKSNLNVGQNALIGGALTVSGSLATTSIGSPVFNAGMLDANTNGISDIANLYHSVASTTANPVAAGIGTGLLFSNSTTYNQIASTSRIASIFTANNGVSTTSALAFFNLNGTSMAEGMRLTSAGNLGLGTTSPFAQISIGMASSTNAFAIGVNGSSTPSFLVASANQNGVVSVSSSTPSALFRFTVGGSAYFGSGTTSIVTMHAGIINYPTNATSTILNTTNAWSISTSTAVGNGPVISISGSGATSTISFFGATTTGLTGGISNGPGLASSSKNWISIGNGKTMASVSVHNGNICVDNDGFCGAATTSGKVIARNGFNTANIDLAEEFPSTDSLMAGQIVNTVGTSSIGLASRNNGHTIIGIVSTAPGVLLGLGPDDSGAGKYPVALAGRVPLKVNLDNGPILAGDRITLSTSTPGTGMKAGPYDETVGVALEPYNEYTLGTGIMAFVNLRNNADMLALAKQVASSSATTTTDWVTTTAFATSTSFVKTALSNVFNAIAGIAQTGVRHLGSAVYATAGVFNSLVTDSLTAEVVRTNNLTVGSSATPVGITLYDQVSHAPYCVSMRDGALVSEGGVCGTQTTGSQGSVPSSGGSGSGGSTDTTPPTITIVGMNPTTISVGDTYIDLGATVDDNVDHNLGIHTYLDGVFNDSFSLDTSTPTTHTIDYVATDSAGNTATSTRTVVVQ